MVEKAVMLEVAAGSWLVEDNESLVRFKTFPLRYDGEHAWQL